MNTLPDLPPFGLVRSVFFAEKRIFTFYPHDFHKNHTKKYLILCADGIIYYR